MTDVEVGRLDDLADPGSLGFSIKTAGREVDCFLVRRGGAVFGYRNSCPHTGAPLDWQPDQFLDPSGELIQCALHGALFEIESGVCISGPCPGRSLVRVHLRLVEGRILIR